MLLLCESSVVDRRHVKSAPIPCPSQITLIDEVVNFQKHLHLQITKTENGHRSEQRYQLNNNLSKLDTQYVNDNILLISLRNPKYNIFIKCDKAQLNFFVKTLKNACGHRVGNPAFKPLVKCVWKTSTRPNLNNFAGPAPISVAPKPIGGIGLKLLQNMGWKPGEGLGKDKTGVVEPLLLEQKNDKIGLYTSEDNVKHFGKGAQPHIAYRKPKAEITFEGKHPVSQLSELAARNKWKTPEYDFTLLKESDLRSDRKFFFRVTINGTKYESIVDALKKKDAKLFAAQYVLQELELIEPVTESASSGEQTSIEQPSPSN